ncbi:MAG TPA: cupin domain-containing protein [Steroidobacteraceae bacterium]|jgi:quercetin dioxygenase-like cupin family protein
MRLLLRLAAMGVGTLLTIGASAAQLGDSAYRTEVHRADLSGAPGMEVIASLVRVKPGESTPRHFHHGIEAAYVVHGTMVQYPGQAPQMLKTGSTLFNLRDAVHSGFKVVGPDTLVIYTVHVVDKGKRLYEPAARAGQ